MDERDWLASRFEEHRSHLRSVAYRMLGSLSEADDAVQEAWLRLSRSDTSEVENLGGWLTTVVARVSLDMLRSRRSRREESLAAPAAQRVPSGGRNVDPEEEALLADSVGLALLVVLETLGPAERLAFVLHDMFGVPFDEIAPIIGRTPAATRQLASRARRRVRGTPPRSRDAIDGQRAIIDRFLTAVRSGDFDTLLTILDPNIVFRADRPLPLHDATEIRDREQVAQLAMRGGARAARPALINGQVGVVVAPRGRLFMVLNFQVEGNRIVGIEAVTNRERLEQLELAVLSD